MVTVQSIPLVSQMRKARPSKSLESLSLEKQPHVYTARHVQGGLTTAFFIKAKYWKQSKMFMTREMLNRLNFSNEKA